jgi:hypothetical protein
MRFQAGQWVEDDGTPIDTSTMQTFSRPGQAPADDAEQPDPRKTSEPKTDPRKNKSAQ